MEAAASKRLPTIRAGEELKGKDLRFIFYFIDRTLAKNIAAKN